MLVVSFSIFSTNIADVKLEIGIAMVCRLIRYKVFLSGFQSCQHLHFFWLTFISILTGNLLQLEFISDAFQHQSLVIHSHHN